MVRSAAEWGCGFAGPRGFVATEGGVDSESLVWIPGGAGRLTLPNPLGWAPTGAMLIGIQAAQGWHPPLVAMMIFPFGGAHR
jgi:hypothetical protein